VLFPFTNIYLSVQLNKCIFFCLTLTTVEKMYHITWIGIKVLVQKFVLKRILSLTCLSKGGIVKVSSMTTREIKADIDFIVSDWT
jgi:hypothetical protein